MPALALLDLVASASLAGLLDAGALLTRHVASACLAGLLRCWHLFARLVASASLAGLLPSTLSLGLLALVPISSRCLLLKNNVGRKSGCAPQL